MKALNSHEVIRMLCRGFLTSLLLLFTIQTSFAQESNDCTSASPIACGDVVSGTTVGATASQIPACGLSSFGPGIWFEITGTGAGITLSTCNPGTAGDFDTELAVFSGSCGSLSCVASNTNAGVGNCANPRHSIVTFDSEAGETYYIYLTGAASDAGSYQLSVSCEAPPITNDVCSGATALTVGAPGVCNPIDGDTRDATDDGFFSCDSFGGNAGLWYSFVAPSSGSVNIQVADLGPGNPEAALFTSCGGTEVWCDGSPDDEAVSGLTPGATYYLVVWGDVSFGQGPFTVCVSELSAVTNDDACDAEPLQIGVTTSFSNLGATAQPGEPNPGPGTTGSSCNSTDGWCSFELDVDNSIWFTFVAPATGCVNIDVLDADLQLAVWSVGNCANFSSYVEVGANDDGGPGLSPALSDLAVTPGATYYIQIDGYNGAVETNGTVLVSASTACGPVAPPVAFTCDEALPLGCGEAITGSTTGAPTNSFGTSCGSSQSDNISTAPGVWYTYAGDGNRVTVSTCNSGTDYDIKLAAFSGSCGNLSCVAVNDNSGSCGDGPVFGRNAEISFVTVPGVTYYVYVTGHQGANGNFQLDVTCAVGNDDCVDALPIECGETVTGSTALATPDSAPFCGTSVSSSARGVWYTITGNGNTLTASLCGSDYDTKLFVYEGSCGALSCVAGNDDFCGLDSQVSWPSEDGVTYYILVSGFSSFSFGDYILSIPGDCSTGGGDDNNFCGGATDIGCGDVVSGTTADATAESLPFCGTSLSSAPGRWYRFVGTGDEVEVTTCNAGSNYDTKLGVFEGSCGNLICVGGNDDSSCSFSGLRSRVEFVSTPGVEYFIYVTGFGSSSGSYELSLTCTMPMANPNCTAATEVLCGDNITGSTVGQASNDLDLCGTSLNTAGGTFYRFVGTGDNVTVTTCNAGSNYDTKLGVFTGSCDNLICVGGNDDSTCSFSNLRSTVTFATTNGQTYYIYVTGFGTATGNYEMTIDCAAPLTGGTTNSIAQTAGSLDLEQNQREATFGIGDIFPNPVQYDLANIRIYAPIEAEAHIQLFDQVGRLASNQEVELFTGVNNIELRVADLPAGSYYAIIRVDGAVFNKKLVIAR